MGCGFFLSRHPRRSLSDTAQTNEFWWLMSNRVPTNASIGGALPDTADGSAQPNARGTWVRPDLASSSERNRLLAGLPAADFSLLSQHMKDMVLQQGVVLQEQGERVEDIYFPHDGIVSLLAIMQQGDAIEIATIGREGAIGSLAGLGPRRSHTRAVVQVTGTASRIPAARFRKAAEDSQAIRDIIMRYGEVLLIQVQQTAACNALHDVEERLSRWLLQARDRVNSNTIRLTHEFLSQMLGVRRPTVTVVARMLQDAGLIRYHRGHIEIVDRGGLEAKACECYETIRRQIDGIAHPAKR
jgi:CRP-like cAMP-binding protein